jgi:D-3-phosphoglycerate dehydrogenase
VLGCGAAGQTVARLCRAFGATVLAHEIRVYEHFYPDASVTAVGFDALLSESDNVTIHLPLDSTTAGLIDARALQQMKPSVFSRHTRAGRSRKKQRWRQPWPRDVWPARRPMCSPWNRRAGRRC